MPEMVTSPHWGKVTHHHLARVSMLSMFDEVVFPETESLLCCVIIHMPSQQSGAVLWFLRVSCVQEFHSQKGTPHEARRPCRHFLIPPQASLSGTVPALETH